MGNNNSSSGQSMIYTMFTDTSKITSITKTFHFNILKESVPKIVEIFDPNPIYDYFLSLLPKKDEKPPFCDLTLNVTFSNKKQETSNSKKKTQQTFYANKIFFYASCEKLQDLTSNDILNLEVEDEETFDLILYFLYGGRLKEQFYILETLIKLLKFSCKYDMKTFSRIIELEITKYLRKRNLQFEEFSNFLKKNNLENENENILYVLKHSFNQFCLQIDVGTIETKNHLKPMIGSSIASDITLNLNGELIHAHKIILTRVQYFVTMLSMGMIESQMDEIEILEEKEPFNQILYYIYTGDINPIYYQHTLHVMHLWEKMNIEYRLRNLCISLIYDKMLDETNIIDVYNYAVGAEDSLLIYACEVFVSYHKDDLEEKNLLKELKMNPQNIESTEETIYLYRNILKPSNDFKFISNTTRFVNLMGSIEVGKKTFMSMLLNDDFETHGTKSFTDTLSNNTMNLSINLINSREDSEKIVKLIKGTHAFILCYSVTDLKSFKKISEYLKLIYELNRDEYVITIVASKCDVFYSRIVSSEAGLKLAEENNCSYLEAAPNYHTEKECLSDICQRINNLKE
eukprot:gene2664-3860_t